MSRRALFFILMVLSVFIIPITGCSNGECKKARLEAENSLDKYTALEKEQSDLERELWYEYSEYCSNLPERESPLDLPWDDLYCKGWEDAGKPVSYVTINNQEIARLSDEIMNEKRRWAITVTTYEECFEPSQVISGQEILRS